METSSSYLCWFCIKILSCQKRIIFFLHFMFKNNWCYRMYNWHYCLITCSEKICHQVTRNIKPHRRKKWKKYSRGFSFEWVIFNESFRQISLCKIWKSKIFKFNSRFLQLIHGHWWTSSNFWQILSKQHLTIH